MGFNRSRRTRNCDARRLPVLSFDGYTCLSSTRKTRSGGLLVCVRDKYAKSVTRLEGLSENVLWILFEGSFAEFPLLFGCVYISPEGYGYTLTSELTFTVIYHCMLALGGFVWS
jgi:hypothetical protein